MIQKKSTKASGSPPESSHFFHVPRVTHHQVTAKVGLTSDLNGEGSFIDSVRILNA